MLNCLNFLEKTKISLVSFIKNSVGILVFVFVCHFVGAVENRDVDGKEQESVGQVEENSTSEEDDDKEEEDFSGIEEGQKKKDNTKEEIGDQEEKEDESVQEDPTEEVETTQVTESNEGVLETESEQEKILPVMLLNTTKPEKESEGKEIEPENSEGKDSAESDKKFEKIYINEVFPNPSSEENNSKNCLINGKDLCEEEWIELYNSGDKNVELEGYTLIDKNLFESDRYNCEKIKNKFAFDKNVDLKGCSLTNNNLFSKDTCEEIRKKFVFDEDDILKAGGFKIFKKSEFKFTLNNTKEDVYLLGNECIEIKKVSYEDKGGKNLSYALNSEGNWWWTELITPGDKNKFPVPKVYSKKIEITEVLPNPDGKDKNQEWLEVFNSDEEEIDFEGWYFLNQSNQKFKLDGLKIQSKQRLKVEIKNSSFSVKNSQGKIELFNPNDELVDKVKYLESAKVNCSWNKNQSGEWLWSIFSTPGRGNKFNNLPTYKVDISDKIYKDVKTEFKIKKLIDLDGEVLKYRWDFGDGSRSYLKETSHTFSKKGRYTILTRVSDLSADVFKNFRINVEKFPELDLKIVKILPNPDGPDSENEKIWIKNEEEKTINLKGWIIATGKSSGSLVNHYVKDDLKINSGKTKSIDRENCSFSLLNKKGRVVLKAPNKEIVDKVKYKKDKIEKDEMYVLVGDVWVWDNPNLNISQDLETSMVPVLGETKTAPEEQSLNLIELLDNPKLNRTNRLKVLYFENWLFKNSQNHFSKFIFPKSFLDKFK